MVDHRQMRLRNKAVGRGYCTRDKKALAYIVPHIPKGTDSSCWENLELTPKNCHAHEASSWEANPLLLADKACFCRLRNTSPSHRSEEHTPQCHHLSLSASGAIIFHPARNKQTPASRWRWQADMVPILPSCDRASGHGPGKKIRSTGAPRFPLLFPSSFAFFLENKGISVQLNNQNRLYSGCSLECRHRLYVWDCGP